jgi:hypothetical protein
MATYELKDLRSIAVEHISYEVTTLIDEVRAVRNLSLAGLAHTPDGTVLRRALLEGSLVHLRLLDDFFRFEANPSPPKKGKPKDDVTAQHYWAEWPPKALLEKAERDGINAQLAHLAARRRGQYPWHLGELVIRTSSRLCIFVDGLRLAHPDRADWFDVPYQRALGVLGGRQTFTGTFLSTDTSSM